MSPISRGVAVSEVCLCFLRRKNHARKLTIKSKATLAITAPDIAPGLVLLLLGGLVDGKEGGVIEAELMVAEEV